MINLNSNRAASKSINKKKLTLNCISTEEMGRSRPLQPLSISMSSVNMESSRRDEDRRRNKMQKEIVINLSKTD